MALVVPTLVGLSTAPFQFFVDKVGHNCPKSVTPASRQDRSLSLSQGCISYTNTSLPNFSPHKHVKVCVCVCVCVQKKERERKPATGAATLDNSLLVVVEATCLYRGWKKRGGGVSPVSFLSGGWGWRGEYYIIGRRSFWKQLRRFKVLEEHAMVCSSSSRAGKLVVSKEVFSQICCHRFFCL